MVSESPPPAVAYRLLEPGGESVTVMGEHPEVAWKLWGAPSAGMVAGVTEHPESVTLVAGPEFAIVIWIISFTFAVREKVPELPELFGSLGYVAVIVADAFGV